ncbi:hypothetical protein GHT06_017974 [Daphnia sinensis]|uniref:DNA excision repair protein ERCC-8 n=1 Tax=Daphnia sinensis TaxID=1820382 RepID=A0AAD5KMJ0_9CRUS|nr:hypothetical protein GHT06_017974 [Daphnia sinensis]
MNDVDAICNLKTGLIDARKFRSNQATKRVSTLCLSNFQEVENSHSAGINTIDLDKVEGRYLLSGGADGSIHIHDVLNLSGNLQFTCKNVGKIDRQSNRYCHKYSVECVQWYPLDTGMFLSSGMDKHLKIWDANAQIPADVVIINGKIYHHHMSPNATQHNLVAVASTANQVFLADLRSGSTTHELRCHSSSVLSVKWSPMQEFQLASGSMDNRLLMWDVRASRSCLFSMDQDNGRNHANVEKTTAHNGYVHSLSFTSDGLFLISVGTDSRMRLWNSETGRNEMINYGKILMESKKGTRFDISSDTDPQMVFVPSQGNILVYELTTGIKRATLLGHYNTVTCCAYNENLHTLYSGSNDRNILVWAPEAAEKIREDPVNKEVGFGSRSLMPRRTLTEDAWSSDEG